MSFSPYRQTHLELRQDLCVRCSTVMPDTGARPCMRCHVKYCGQQCQWLDVEFHRQFSCRLPFLTNAQLASVPDRLHHGARKFMKTFNHEVMIAAVHGYFLELDRYAGLPTEAPYNFMQRFRDLSRQSIWSITLQEKSTAPRLGKIYAHHMCYVPNTGHRMVQADWTDNAAPIQAVLDYKEATLGAAGAGVIIGVNVNDWLGAYCGDFTVCVNVPEVTTLQYAYLSQCSEDDLTLCSSN